MVGDRLPEHRAKAESAGGESALEEFSLASRFRYHLDRVAAKSAVWQVLMLAVVAALLMVLGALFVSGSSPESLGREGSVGPVYRMWWAAIRVIDPGNFAGDFTTGLVAATGLTISLLGILIFSLLIGILSSKLTEKLELMKRGKSPVVEHNHTVIVGSGDKLFEVVREIVEANSNHRGRAIAVFSPVPKQDMEEAMNERIGDFMTTRMAYRTGRTSDMDALRMLNLPAARSLVVLGGTDPDNVKVLLAARSLMGEKRRKAISAVCEIRDQRMGEIAELSFPGVRWIPVGEMITRLMVQVCRHPGLSKVYSEILSFRGHELYLYADRRLAGRQFGSLAQTMHGGIALGIMRPGGVELNPMPDAVLQKGDELVVLAEDDDTFGLAHDRRPKPLERCGSSQRPEPVAESILVLSANRRSLRLMMNLLGNYVGAGSSAVIAGALDDDEAKALLEEVRETPNLEISYRRVCRTSPRQLEKLRPFDFDSILVTSLEDDDDESSDTDCITTLLVLKRIRNGLEEEPETVIVSEIRNPRNRRLANTADIDDFVVSNEVTSMIMAQLAEEARLWDVYREIFDPRGCEIYLRSASWICPGRKSATFMELVRSGLNKREVVMGIIEPDGKGDEVLKLNPKPEESVDLRNDIQVVTLAER